MIRKRCLHSINLSPSENTIRPRSFITLIVPSFLPDSAVRYILFLSVLQVFVQPDAVHAFVHMACPDCPEGSTSKVRAVVEPFHIMAELPAFRRMPFKNTQIVVGYLQQDFFSMQGTFTKSCTSSARVGAGMAFCLQSAFPGCGRLSTDIYVGDVQLCSSVPESGTDVLPASDKT